VSLSKTTFFFCLSFITGIFFAPISIMVGLFLTLFTYIFLKNRLLVVFCLLFFIIGAFSFHHAFYSIPSKIESSVYGKVAEEPSVRGDFQRIILEHEKGRALLYVDRYADYKYGDFLKVKGEFNEPEIEDYANYLRKEGVYHTSFYPEIEKKGNKGSFFLKTIFSLKEKARENIRKSVPVPQVFFLEAMILGERDSFTEKFGEKLSISGTRHITAISGMHIVIISGILFFFFLFMGIKKKWAGILSLFFMILFIVFVGAPASAVRAGIMGGALLLSYTAYRQTNSFRLVVVAAAVMLAFNPLLLHYDLGFQMSFLAVFGILTLHNPIKNKITTFLEVSSPISLWPAEKTRLFFRKNGWIADLVAVTLSAQIFVFPLVLYNFGHISLFSVPANVLIVPLLPFIIPLGFLTAITGFVGFAFPVYLLLSFVLFVIDTVYLLPFSAVHIGGVSSFLVFLFYVWLFYKISSFKKSG